MPQITVFVHQVEGNTQRKLQQVQLELQKSEGKAREAHKQCKEAWAHCQDVQGQHDKQCQLQEKMKMELALMKAVDAEKNKQIDLMTQRVEHLSGRNISQLSGEQMSELKINLENALHNVIAETSRR